MRSMEVGLVEKFDTVKVNDRDKRSLAQIGFVEVNSKFDTDNFDRDRLGREVW